MIEKLWNGSIAPIATCGSDSMEVQELAELIQRNKDDLGKELNERQKEILIKLLDCFEEQTYLLSMHAFEKGFSLAVKLMTEAGAVS